MRGSDVSHHKRSIEIDVNIDNGFRCIGGMYLCKRVERFRWPLAFAPKCTI